MTEILMLARRTGNQLNETMEISRQLADAVDRRDEISMKMIIAMRSETIGKLTDTDRALRELVSQLGDNEEGVRIRAILNGDVQQAATEQEKLLAEQAAMNIRAHRKVMELDEVLNRKIAREKSIYHND